MTHTLQLDGAQTFSFQAAGPHVFMTRRAVTPSGRLLVTGEFKFSTTEARAQWIDLLNKGAKPCNR